MAHSKGVSLREIRNLTGARFWRDEMRGDFGSKKRARRAVRAMLTADTRRIIREELAAIG